MNPHHPGIYFAFVEFLAARVNQAAPELRRKLARSKATRDLFLAYQFGVFASLLPSG